MCVRHEGSQAGRLCHILSEPGPASCFKEVVVKLTKGERLCGNQF
jgi:hypothetical protein